MDSENKKSLNADEDDLEEGAQGPVGEDSQGPEGEPLIKQGLPLVARPATKGVASFSNVSLAKSHSQMWEEGKVQVINEEEDMGEDAPKGHKKESKPVKKSLFTSAELSKAASGLHSPAKEGVVEQKTPAGSRSEGTKTTYRPATVVESGQHAEGKYPIKGYLHTKGDDQKRLTSKVERTLPKDIDPRGGRLPYGRGKFDVSTKAGQDAYAKAAGVGVSKLTPTVRSVLSSKSTPPPVERISDEDLSKMAQSRMVAAETIQAKKAIDDERDAGRKKREDEREARLRKEGEKTTKDIFDRVGGLLGKSITELRYGSQLSPVYNVGGSCGVCGKISKSCTGKGCCEDCKKSMATTQWHKSHLA